MTHIQSKMAICILATFMVMAFQNCGNQMNFASEAASLVAVQDPVVTDGTPLSNGDGSSSVPNANPPPQAPGQSQNVDDGDHSCPNSGFHNKPNVDDGDTVYVCVLDGPGSSIKVGLTDTQLLGKNATPNDVCMSPHACLDIVSKVLSVKAPAYRGFCKQGGAKTIRLEDDEIQRIVAKMSTK